MTVPRDELNLGGDWLLVLDPEDRGMREQWYATPPKQGGMPARVPAVWDLWVPDYDGVGWYFRDVEIPASWIKRRVELHFEAVNYFAEAWWNGQYLGAHEGGYTPFMFDVSPYLREGANRLAARVIDPKGEQGFGPFHPKELPIAKEVGYWSFGGIWGDVRLHSMPHAHITDIFIKPDLRRRRIICDVSVQGAPADVSARLSIPDTPFTAEGEPGSLTLDIPDFQMWSPASPHLYTLQAELAHGRQTLDISSARFGMREFTVKDQRFHLNAHPVFIKGVLYQPDYPRMLAGPPSIEAARHDIQLALDAGFNLMRLHIKPAPPYLLDLADEMGMMLYAEPSIGWIKASERMQARCEASVREMVLRDRNHPSLVLWGILNETGNADYVTGGGAQLIKDSLCRLARSLDPTRVILDDSAGVNATREPARMLRPWRSDFEEYDELHIYQRAPVDTLIESYYRNSGEPGQLTFVSEFGFGGPEDLEAVLQRYGEDRHRLKDAQFLRRMLEACNQGFLERGLDKLFGDFSGLARAAQELQCDAARMQIAAMRSNAKIAGYCYTQLADAGHEFCAGVTDRWRQPKPAMKAIADAQRPLGLLIQVTKTNLTPREETEVTILLANEEQRSGMAELSLQVIGPTGQMLWKKKRELKLPRHRQVFWQGTIAASGSAGAHRFVVRLFVEGQRVFESETGLLVLEPVAKAEAPAHLLDPDKMFGQRCGELVALENLLAPVHVIPPLANTIRAYPDNELLQVLAQVKAGAVALFFQPPDDWNDLAELLDPTLSATPKDAVGGFLPAAHYAKLHPIFEKLPTRGLMRQPYKNVIAAKTFLETSDEDICGTFDTAPVAAGNYMVGKTDWYGSDILVKRYGVGRLVFIHLRLFEHLRHDPVADRLFVNMINHFARRSLPVGIPMPPDAHAVEWLRIQRNQATRRWMIIGEFPNWGGEGLEKVYAPEQKVDFDAIYPGWYQPALWRRWFSCARDKHVVDLQVALEPVFQWYPKFDRSVAYAYAELMSEKRLETRMRIGIQDAMKVFLNGNLVFETRRQTPHDRFEQDSVPVIIRKGRNVLLVKIAKIPGPFKFSVDFDVMQETPQWVKWWK